MASLLNNASLLLNPAGSVISYQEDKIYSVLPNNGAGDFTFTGGDGGTRVNQDGYIESTPANLAFQSNAFSTSPWARQNTTLTSGQSDPLGGTNAWKVEFSAAQAYLFQFPTSPASGVVTISAFLRADSTTTIGFNDGAANPNSITIGTTWQRYEFTYTVSANFYVIQFDNYFGVSPGNLAKTFYVYGSQLNIGSTALPYQPTTDRLNYPRITYQNGRGALLSEPQRTNLTQGSNGLTTNWTNYRGTYTANAISSPDGTVNAPLTVWDGTVDPSVGFFFQNFTFAGSTTYCFSVFLKYYNVPIVNLGYADRSNPFLGGGANFNIANGTFINVEGDATTGIIESYEDGWYRCTVVFTTAATPSFNYVAVNMGGVTVGQGFYAYGCQLEIGPSPSSYIPTTTATVTRPRDITENSSATSVIGQTEGVLYTDFIWNSAKGAGDFLVLTVSNGTTANNIFLDIFSNTAVFGVDSSSSRVAQLQSGTITNGRHKMAGVYKNNDFAFFLDGNLIGTDTAGSVPACSVVDVGGWANGTLPFDGELHTSALFTSRLTNTQLAELTTVRSGSGGTISYYGPYTIHTFTGSGTFTPSFNGEVEVLVVAGGGGGGGRHAGGGGAGGLLYASSFGVAASSGVTTTVGAGGVAGGYGGRGGNGSNSSFGGLTSIGGGGGGGFTGGPTISGSNGGSGGGGAGAEGLASGNGIGGLGILGQGNNGGNPSTGPYGAGGFSGGGGGGASAVGGNVIDPNGGDGGNGLPYSISGFSTYYAGGGGGAGDGNVAATGGTGGLGGGGNGTGAYFPAQGTAGTPNTGGGGGGSRDQAGMAGGSGIIIVRYLT